MSERRILHLSGVRDTPQSQPKPDWHAVNVGTHMLEILDDQSILLADRTTGSETMHLNKDECYRLYLILLEMFREEMRQNQRAATGGKEMEG